MQYHHLDVLILQGEQFFLDVYLCWQKHCLYLTQLDILYNTEYLNEVDVP